MGAKRLSTVDWDVNDSVEREWEGSKRFSKRISSELTRSEKVGSGMRQERELRVDYVDMLQRKGVIARRSHT